MLLREVRWQVCLYLRDRVAVFFTFAFPLLLFFVWARRAGGETTYAAALMTALALAMAAYAGLAMGIASAKEAGMVRRIRSTPLPLGVHVCARLLASGLIGAASVALTLAFGAVLWDLPLSFGRLLAMAPGLILGLLALGGWGLLIGSYAANASAASYLVNLTLFPIFLAESALLSGTLPEWSAALVRLLLLHGLAVSIQAPLAGAGVPPAGTLGTLALWALLGTTLAARQLAGTR